MTQFRADEGLAFMLQYENVAWYDAGEVQILDRPQNLIIKELIQYANKIQPIVSALLCLMGWYIG